MVFTAMAATRKDHEHVYKTYSLPSPNPPRYEGTRVQYGIGAVFPRDSRYRFLFTSSHPGFSIPLEYVLLYTLSEALL
jgi:hypothetical protein